MKTILSILLLSSGLIYGQERFTGSGDQNYSTLESFLLGFEGPPKMLGSSYIKLMDHIKTAKEEDPLRFVGISGRAILSWAHPAELPPILFTKSADYNEAVLLCMVGIDEELPARGSALDKLRAASKDILKDSDIEEKRWIDEILIVASGVKPAKPNFAVAVTSGVSTRQNVKSTGGSPKGKLLLENLRRPANSGILKQPKVLGNCPFKVSNGNLTSAIVKLIDKETDEKVLSLFIKPFDVFTFSRMPAGNYRLIYCSGGDAIYGIDRFQHPKISTEHTETIDFYELLGQANGMSVTLHEVPEGNAITKPIDMAEFEKY